MPKQSDSDDWDERKERIIGLGERSFRKSYYPQLRQNIDRLERFHTLLNHTSDFVILVALPDGTISDANAAVGRLLGEPVAALLERPFASVGLGNATAILDKLRKEISLGGATGVGKAHSAVAEFVRGNSLIWVDLSYRIAILDKRYYAVMVGRDITEQKRNYEMVKDLLAEKEALLENALVGIVMVRARTIVSSNRRVDEIFRCPPGSMVGQSTRVLYDTDNSYEAFGAEAYRALSHGERFTGTVIMRRADGETFWCELTGNALNASDPQAGSIWILSDVSERKLAEDRAKFLSFHDALTGLPNPLLLRDRLQQAIAFSDRVGSKLALMVVDIDRFKAINDFLGHRGGDRLLVDAAERLQNSVRSADTVSRQGGDEFIVLLTNFFEPDAAITFLGELQARFQEPFSIDGREVSLSISIGVAIYPEDGADFEALLRKADMAMYRAKEAGRNAYRFFNEGMNDDASEQITLSSGLRRALAEKQFVLNFQPQIEIASGRVVGAEALIRWNHPDLGLVSPGRFIPVAEETGLIVEIGDWVLHEACRNAAEWRRAGFKNPTVAVNLSAIQFKRGGIEQSVDDALRSSGLEPEMLELELTESILIGDTENVLATVKRLKLMGIRLSIDDFGTGYSSLSYLKRFEADKLKIDQSFIRDLANNSEDAAIVRAIIQMAHSLGLKTIAEGVESSATFELLSRYQCDEAQGFFHGRPMKSSDFVSYFQSHAKDG